MPRLAVLLSYLPISPAIASFAAAAGRGRRRPRYSQSGSATWPARSRALRSARDFWLVILRLSEQGRAEAETSGATKRKTFSRLPPLNYLIPSQKYPKNSTRTSRPSRSCYSSWQTSDSLLPQLIYLEKQLSRHIRSVTSLKRQQTFYPRGWERATCNIARFANEQSARGDHLRSGTCLMLMTKSRDEEREV